MAQVHITLDTTDPDDAAILARIYGGPAIVDASGLSAAEKPKRAARRGDKPEEGSTTDATAASPATEPVTPAEQQTPEQQKVVDPDIAAAQAGDAYAGKTQPVTGAKAPESEPEVSADDVMGETSGTPTAAAPQDVTLESLKAIMTKALAKNSAKVCQDAVRGAADGAASLTAAAAQHYPAIYAALSPLAAE